MAAQVTQTALVTGATGLLGRQVIKEFGIRKWNVKGAGFNRADGQDILKLDLANAAQVEKTLDDVRPQVVIHCAANKYPDKVEKDPDAAHALNVAATKDLAQFCAARSTLLIYISTDYVFPGRQGEAPYDASHKIEPTTLYGLLKADGEAAVLREFEKVPGSEGLGVVLRVPVLYGEAEMPSESAVNTLMDTVWEAQKIVEEGEKVAKIKVDHWALRYPTCTEDVGRVCHDIAAKYLAEGPTNSLPRILQFSSEDTMTKYEICQTFAEIMGLSADGLEPNTEGNDPTPGTVARPYDCHLSTKALQELGISVSTCDFKAWWRREVRAFRK